MSDRGGNTTDEQFDELLAQIRRLHSDRPNWVVFYRDVFGVGSLVRRSLGASAIEFFLSPQGSESLELLTDLRSRQGEGAEFEARGERRRMLTIRWPQSCHLALQLEAENLGGLSNNQLAISKLLLPISPWHVPVFSGRRRGRRPGPQRKIRVSD